MVKNSLQAVSTIHPDQEGKGFHWPLVSQGFRPSVRQTQKADRAERLERSSTRSAYSLTSPRLTAVAVYLVSRLFLLTHDTAFFQERKTEPFLAENRTVLETAK
jgi:hypothetical protein